LLRSGAKRHQHWQSTFVLGVFRVNRVSFPELNRDQDVGGGGDCNTALTQMMAFGSGPLPFNIAANWPMFVSLASNSGLVTKPQK